MRGACRRKGPDEEGRDRDAEDDVRDEDDDHDHEPDAAALLGEDWDLRVGIGLWGAAAVSAVLHQPWGGSHADGGAGHAR